MYALMSHLIVTPHQQCNRTEESLRSSSTKCASLADLYQTVCRAQIGFRPAGHGSEMSVRHICHLHHKWDIVNGEILSRYTCCQSSDCRDHHSHPAKHLPTLIELLLVHTWLTCICTAAATGTCVLAACQSSITTAAFLFFISIFFNKHRVSMRSVGAPHPWLDMLPTMTFVCVCVGRLACEYI